MRPTNTSIGTAGLSRWVDKSFSKNEGQVIVDKTMSCGEDEMVDVMGALKLGLMCTSRSAGDRPTMKEVCTFLDNLHVFGLAQLSRGTRKK